MVLAYCMVCATVILATSLGIMLFVAPVRAYLCAFRPGSVNLVKDSLPGVMSLNQRRSYSSITAKSTCLNRFYKFRGFGTLDPTSGDAASKQQKLQDLISAYQTKGQVGPVDRSKLKTVLESQVGTQPSEPGSRKVFDDTMKFPTEFMIKIVGQNEPEFVADMLNTVKRCLDANHQQNFPFSTKETAGGKYVSLTVKPVFQNAEELYTTYEAIGKDKRVKMTL